MELDGSVVVGDGVFAEAVELDGFDDALESGHELVEIELIHVEVFALGLGDRASQSFTVGGGSPGWVAPVPVFATVLKGVTGFAEGAVFEELAEQFGGGVEFLLVAGGACGVLASLILGIDHAGLDFDERGGDDQEFTSGLDIDIGEVLDVVEVLIGDGAEGDLGDVEFDAPDEVQEEVERTFEGIEAHGVWLHRHPFRSPKAAGCARCSPNRSF